ncbi:cytospin-A-like isoform X2 [Ornithodoros turicata]|uniref:cytospin-A-like isoform X2 n=1 Tax=Ornithodoros turicata TaxID=34597 RepID=UPI003139FC08
MRNARCTGTLRSAGNRATPDDPRTLKTFRKPGSKERLDKQDTTVQTTCRPQPASQPSRTKFATKGLPSRVNKENMLSGPLMRRASSLKSSSSKDSLDSTGSKEKRARPKSACQGWLNIGQRTVGTQTEKGSAAEAEKAPVNIILQLEKEKSLLEQQISELVRNAEGKKAEIVTLRMEVKRLKETTVDAWKLDAAEAENQRLRERLLEMGAPIEQTALSDTDKEQFLLRRSASGSFGSLDGREAVRSSPKSAEGALSDPEAGASLGSRDWDKGSTSSVSEMSVACLQDRIMQMEETHYSTNEELQATLQELTDLQDQLTDLQLENERWGDEKSVLFTKLCTQTEELEDYMAQLTHLKALLLQQDPCLDSQSREYHYIQLIQRGEGEVQALQAKVRELEAALEGASQEVQDAHWDRAGLAERVALLQAALEAQGTEAQGTQRSEQGSIPSAQEQLAVAQHEAAAQVAVLEHQIAQLEAEKTQLAEEWELKCQKHLEEKRQLRGTVAELQNSLADTGALLGAAHRDLQAIRSQHQLETEEWKQFEADLLTTVRVANDFKTEAQQEVERMHCDNQQLQEKVEALEAQLEKLKLQQQLHQGKQAPELSPKNGLAIHPESGDASGTARRSLPKWGDFRGSAQPSVRSLIESIERQAKGPSSRSSSASSLNSMASDARPVATTLPLGTPGEAFLKPSLKQADKSRLQRATVEKACPSSEGVARQDVEKPISILANKLDPIRRNSYSDLIMEKKDPLASLVKGGGSKRNALLKWCQSKTLGYKGIDITNFSSSWNDGLAFCALLHTYLGDSKIPYDQLDSKDKRRNFSIAFEAAETVGIPSTLLVNELIALERPDWQSIMAYVTSIYKHFEASV